MRRCETIVVIGAGAFGTALAAVVALENRHDVTLLGRDRARMAEIEAGGMHDKVLPGARLPGGMCFSSEPDILRQASIVLFAMPSQAQAQAVRQYGPYLAQDAMLITCAKGLDLSSGSLLTDLLERELPHHPVAVLSGPGFAADIARELPTAMAIAARDIADAERLAAVISGRSFRLYASTDRIGVQLGGALKNVLAIACGIVEATGLGESARAALIARGLAEMSRLAVAVGGKADTVRGLSGLGDLVLTATSHQSRNLRFGIALGKGEMTDKTGDKSAGELVEGAFAATIAVRLAKDFSVSMPITDAVAAIIAGKLDVTGAMHQLMTRPITTE